MRLHRFYVSQPLGEEVVIEDVSTIKQWLKVFRYREGDFVILFNGDGYNYTYRLQTTSQTSCSLLQTEKLISYAPSRKSFIFLSIIKKDLFELVVEKATECGITDVVPIIVTHTEKKNLDSVRLEKIIKEASEQSGRGSLLTLHAPQTLTEALLTLPTYGVTPESTYIATLLGKPSREILMRKDNTSREKPCAFFIGPEGGWSDEEEKVFINNKYTSISLGETVLRAETAGITCAILASLL